MGRVSFRRSSQKDSIKIFVGHVRSQARWLRLGKLGALEEQPAEFSGPDFPGARRRPIIWRSGSGRKIS